MAAQMATCNANVRLGLTEPASGGPGSVRTHPGAAAATGVLLNRGLASARRRLVQMTVALANVMLVALFCGNHCATRGRLA